MKRNIMLRKLLLLALCLLLLGLCIPGGAEEDPSNAGWTYDEQTKAITITGQIDLSDVTQDYETLRAMLSSPKLFKLIIQGGAVLNAHDTQIASFLENYGTIQGGHFTQTDTSLVRNCPGGEVTGGTFETLKNEGTIAGGVFINTVDNDGDIEQGQFQGRVFNQKTIGGGTFAGPVDNYAKIQGGTFNALVTNNLGGSITGGSFQAVHDSGGFIAPNVNPGTLTSSMEEHAGWRYNTDTSEVYIVDSITLGQNDGGLLAFLNEHGGIESIDIQKGASLNTGEAALEVWFVNRGTISGGSFGGGYNLGTISGGQFTDRVRNSGTIQGGTYKGKVENNQDGIIQGGTFEGFVSNAGKIEGGTFSVISNTGGTVADGVVYIGVGENPSGTGWAYNSASNELTISGAIDLSDAGAAPDADKIRALARTAQSISINEGGALNASGMTITATVYNHGSMEGGTFTGRWVNNFTGGTIAGGTYQTELTNTGTITGGNFAGSVIYNQSEGNIQGGTFGTVYDEGGTISAGLGIHPIKCKGDGWQYTASDDQVTILGNVTLKENEDLQTLLENKGRIDALVVQQNDSLDATGYSLDQFNRLNNAGTIKGGTFICNSVSNSGTIDGGTFGNHMRNEGVIKDGVFNCPVYNYGKIQGGAFTQNVFNEADSEYTGTIAGGTFSGPAVRNAASAKIEGGTFQSHLYNYGAVSKGVFTGQVTNEGELKGGTFGNAPQGQSAKAKSGAAALVNKQTISGGAYYVPVTNYGTVTGGTFASAVSNEEMQEEGQTFTGKLTQGTFNGPVTNAANCTISGGSYSEKVANQGTIQQGTFNGPVTNQGNIKDGQFTASVTNQGHIEDGQFTASVTNASSGQIQGGTFKAGVINEGGQVSEDITGEVTEISPPAPDPGYWVSQDTLTITGALSLEHLSLTGIQQVTVAQGATLTGGQFAGTLTNQGAITGGQFSGTVDNQGVIENGAFAGTVINAGNICAGQFTGPVTNGQQITGGEFSGSVTNDGHIQQGQFAGTVTNNGLIAGGQFSGAINGSQGVIAGGEFSGSVTNDGQIQQGSFAGAILNNGLIAGGQFAGAVTNNGQITGGSLDIGQLVNNGTVDPSVLEPAAIPADAARAVAEKKKLTVPVYSQAGAEIAIALLSPKGTQIQDLAVTQVRFVQEKAREQYQIATQDGRVYQVTARVPEAKKAKSAVAITLSNGAELVTEEISITPSKKLPKVKGQILLDAQGQGQLSLTGGQWETLTVKEGPKWLSFDEQTGQAALTGTFKKGKKLTLTVQLQGWSKPVTVKAEVKQAAKAKLTASLDPAKVSLFAGDPDSQALTALSATTPVERVEQLKAGKSAFQVTYLGEGQLRVGFREDAVSKGETIRLKVYCQGYEKPVTLKLQVKVVQ